MAGICSGRTQSDVDFSADAAALSNRRGLAQILSFSNELMAEDYKLLELPKDILEAFQTGQRVCIRGESQDDAVLCTDSKTYDLKIADTSNTLLLIPSLMTPKSDGFLKEKSIAECQICSSLGSYLELKQTRPKLGRLKHILGKNLYRGPEYEQENASKEKFGTDDLMNVIQASEQEIHNALVSLNAIVIDGYWRLLDVEYQEQVFVRILSLLEEMDWKYTEVPLKECCDILEELEPRPIIEHCLQCYGAKRSSGTEEGCEERVLYELDEDKVCVFYAEYLLRPAGRFNYHEFMESWPQSVPEGMTAKPEHLKGIALVNMTSHPPVIWHFPASDLPEDPGARFNKLFKTQPKWAFEDIEPYIRDLEAPGLSVKALLMKFARSSTDASGVRVYNSKKPLV